MIPLIDVGVREVDDDRTKQFCFELFPLTGDKVKASKSVPGEIGKWIEGSNLPFQRILSFSVFFRSSYSLSYVSIIGR